MLGHYILVALRNFRRSPVATAINVVALALGLTCFVVAYAVVQYWGHAESHFANADRTYAITREMRLKDGTVDTGNQAVTTEFFAKYIKTDFPEFQTVARARSGGEVPFGKTEQAVRLPTVYADPDFLDVFDLPYIAGGGKDALRQPNSVILTDAAAMRLFDSTDVIGRTLPMGGWDLTVTGVIGPIPQPSHLGRSASATLRFDILVSWNVWERVEQMLSPPQQANAPKPPEYWSGGYCCMTYVVLPKGSKATPRSLAPEFAAFVNRRIPPEQRNVLDFKIGMVPIRDLMAMNLESTLFSGKNVGVTVPQLLILFGGLILLVACVNYANLATAQAIKRAKEVGLRKAIGASRVQIATQYLIEAAVLTSAALVLALSVTELMAPVVKNKLNIDLSLALFSGAVFWLFLIGVIAAVAIVAGAYPALYLSRVRPILALKPGDARSGSRLMPTLLVGAQFAAASFLLIAVIVMQAQSSDLRRTGLGTDQDPVIAITNLNDFTKLKPLAFTDALQRLPQVKAASAMADTPWSSSIDLAEFKRSETTGSLHLISYENDVQYGFFSTMNMELLAGRVFDRDRGDDRPIRSAQDFDPKQPANVVVDRAFAQQLGFATPQAAVDQIIYMSMSQMGRPDQPIRIIGVVENKPLHFVGMGATTNVYFLGKDLTYVLVRVSGRDVPGAIKAIEGVWQRMAAPGSYFYHDFVDQLFAQNYELFGRVNLVFGGLALFAFVISTIGLFGMASHVASRRRREIGVRKTLGASTRQILVMLLKDFSKPVVVANVVAWPLAYLAVEAYLSIFIHRIPLSPLPFAASLAITLAIAWVAVGGQAYRAARVKPAAVLRYE